MELKDTVEMMLSDDYKERLKAEYWQTKIRYEKLKNSCNLIEAAQFVDNQIPKYDNTLELLRRQQRHMGEYLHVLELRVIIEHVDIEPKEELE